MGGLCAAVPEREGEKKKKTSKTTGRELRQDLDDLNTPTFFESSRQVPLKGNIQVSGRCLSDTVVTTHEHVLTLCFD